MRCTVCHSEMVANSYENWHVGDRKEVTYLCKAAPCALFPSRASIVTPDNEMSEYSLHVYYNGEMYRIEGSAVNGLVDRQRGGYTRLYKVVTIKLMVEVPTFMPLDTTKDVVEQLRSYCKRLLGLIVFS